MAKFSCVALIAIVAAAIGMVSALTDDEKNTLREVAGPMLVDCGKEYKITKEDVLAAKESHNLDALDSCFYACFFKKAGVMNDQGLYDTETVKGLHKKYIHSEEEVKKADQTTDICSKVNDESVSDGAQGCERAKLLARCLVDNELTWNPLAIGV